MQFASVDEPTGLAVDPAAGRLYVASEGGNILAFATATGALLFEIDTGYTDIMGMAISPGGVLHFVDATSNELVAVSWTEADDCSRDNQNEAFVEFLEEVAEAGVEDKGGLVFEKLTCEINPVLPDDSLFDQVHTDSGYASHDETMEAMTAAALLLADRVDCEVDSDLNFDALLLYVH
jgi:hypothetical protein